MKSQDLHSEPEGAGDFAERGLNPDVRVRLKEAVRAGGGNRAVARLSGVPLSTLNGALAGRTEPRASVMAAIVQTTGHSLDWVFFGKEPMQALAPDLAQPAPSAPPPDVEALAAVVALVEDWLAANRRSMSAAKKGETIAAIYQFVMEDAAAGESRVDSRKVTQFLRLVA